MHIDVGDGLRNGRSIGFRQGRLLKETARVPGRAFVMSGGYSSNNARRPEREGGITAFGRRLKRVILPVLALLAAISAAYLYRAQPFTLIDGIVPATSAWLSWGAIALPLGFFVIHLTNRRYGPAPAAAAVALTWLIIVGVIVAHLLDPRAEIPWINDMAPRTGLALAAALLFSQLVAVVAFDGMRSIRWWSAPLSGFFWASLAFAGVFYPSAYLGTEVAWLGRMAVHFAALLAGGAALTMVYWACRSLVRPLPGFAGY